MTIKINAKHITLNGKRIGVTYSAGPWVSGVNPDLIKIRPRRSSFPAEMREHFAIENNSDGVTDYFECDSIRVLPDHPLYDAVKAAAVSL
jgi:hypothetical protein